MPWTPIDRLPEEAKDGREVDLWEGGERHPRCVWDDGSLEWVCGACLWVRPTHFYDFGEGRTMPDAPEGE